MERLKNWFRDQGLGPEDIPKAVIIHEVLGAGMAIAFWSACYVIQPSSKMFAPVNSAARKNRFLERTYSRALVQAQKTVATMSKRLPGGSRLNTGRLTASLAESICVRAAIKPATFPFKLWASYKMVVATKPREQRRKTAMATVMIFH